MADPSSETGCPRRWYYAYVEGKKEPSSKAQERGVILHGEVADYLTTGVKNISSPILAGMHMIPEPGPDLRVEFDIVPILEDGTSGLHLAPLRAAGVPITGAIDCLHNRGINKGAADFEDMHDPPGTIEVIDWKFVSSLNYIKPGNELIKTIQMSGYAKYVFTVAPETPFVRISHGYMPARGAGRKATALVTKQQVDEAWLHAEDVSRIVQAAAACKSADDVEANIRACHSYGRDCIHMEYCTAAKKNDSPALSELIGGTAASSMLAKARVHLPVIQYQENTMPIETPLLDAMLAKNDALKGNAEVQNAMAELAAREAAVKHKPLIELCTKIRACGIGFPTLTGAAARAYTDAGMKLEEAASGMLKDCTIDDVANLSQVLKEASEFAAMQPKPAAPVIDLAALTPPDAPEPVKPVTAPVVAAEAIPATPTDPLAGLVAAVDKPKRGRKPKAEEAPVVNVVNNAVVVAPIPTPTTATPVDPVTVSPATEKFYFYVDCVPSCTYESFWPVVNKLTTLLTEQSGAPDFRAADPKGPLGYGAWKGVLAAFVREAAKDFKPGHHVLDGATGEVAQVVVEVMRDIVHRAGGVFIRGTR